MRIVDLSHKTIYIVQGFSHSSLAALGNLVLSRSYFVFGLGSIINFVCLFICFSNQSCEVFRELQGCPFNSANQTNLLSSLQEAEIQ